MVDIHSHILHNIDDGASTMEESIQMLEASIASGVNAIVATPHLYPGHYTAPTQERDKRMEALGAEVQRRELPIEIIAGRECFFSPAIYDYEKDLGKLTINDNGKYLLIESPMQEIPKYVTQMIFEIQVQGVTPIIAHVERYADIISDPNRTLKYIDVGCLMQVNIGSVFGRYGETIRRTAEILLTHRMAHIVASDMHSPHSIPLGEGFGLLSEVVGAAEALRLVEERPRAVIENRPALREEASVYRPKRSVKNLWGLFRKPLPSRDDQ